MKMSYRLTQDVILSNKVCRHLVYKLVREVVCY
jgi:hypothetical protein